MFRRIWPAIQHQALPWQLGGSRGPDLAVAFFGHLLRLRVQRRAEWVVTFLDGQSAFCRPPFLAVKANLRRLPEVTILAQGSRLKREGVVCYCVPSAGDLMPLSEEQTKLLKSDSTIINLLAENPKKVGSKAWERYEKYKAATTVGDATRLGAQWQDLSADFEKEYLHFKDVDMNPAVKRAAPEGTPDREGNARAKKKPKPSSTPLALTHSSGSNVNQVQMSAATLSALRAMMREELALGIMDVEARLSRTMENIFGRLHTQIASEREERQQLEDRVRQLEQKLPVPLLNASVDEVDKSIAVVGGFGDRPVEEAESLLKELLAEVCRSGRVSVACHDGK